MSTHSTEAFYTIGSPHYASQPQVCFSHLCLILFTYHNLDLSYSLSPPFQWELEDRVLVLFLIEFLMPKNVLYEGIKEVTIENERKRLKRQSFRRVWEGF